MISDRRRIHTVKLQIIGAVMQPYTAAVNNGQVGTFTLDGAGYSNFTQ